jgi:hypothetical protein
LRRHVGKLQLLDDRVALVYGEEVVAGLDHLIAALVEEGAQALAAGLVRDLRRGRSSGSARSSAARFECLQFHAQDVELDEVDARSYPPSVRITQLIELYLCYRNYAAFIRVYGTKFSWPAL